MDSDQLAQRLTQNQFAGNQIYSHGSSPQEQTHQTYQVSSGQVENVSGFTEKSPIRFNQKTIVNQQGTPRQTVILKEVGIPTSPGQGHIKVVQGPSAYIQTVAVQGGHQGQIQQQGQRQLMGKQELNPLQVNQITSQLSQYGSVIREGNRFVVKQQVPVQIQERIVEVEKPVYYEKPVYVENREEIDALRQRILQLERINQDYYLEVTQLRNKQPQIVTEEKLTYVEDVTKIREMEGKISRLLFEIEGLNRVIVDQKEEVELYKKKWGDVDIQLRQQADITNTYQREIDILRGKLGEIHDVHTDEKENLKRSSRYHEENSLNFRKQNEDLTLNLQQSQIQARDLEQYKNRYSLILEDFEKLKQEQSRYLETISRYESRVVDIKRVEEEVLRLRSILESRDREVSEWVQRCQGLEKKNKELQSLSVRLNEYDTLEADNRRLSDLLIQRQKEGDEWRSRCRTIEIDAQGFQEKYRSLEERYILTQQELERTRQGLSIKLQEIDNLKIQFSRVSEFEGKARDYEQRMVYIRNDYESKINRLADEVKKLNETLRINQDEYESTRINYSKLDLKLRDFQTLENDNKRLSEVLIARNRESEELKLRVNNSESRFIQIQGSSKQYELKINDLSVELERLRSAYSAKITELDEYRNQQRTLVIREYDEKLQIIQQDNERLRQALSARFQEIDSYKQKILEISQYERVVKDQEGKIGLLTQEIDRQRQIQIAKHRESEELRVQISRFGDYENKLREYEGRNQLLTQEIDRQQRAYQEKLQETSSLRASVSKFNEVELRIREYENKINLNQGENERLRAILVERQREIEDLRVRAASITEYQLKIREYESRFQSLAVENERNRGMISSKIQENDSLRVSIRSTGDYEQKIVLLSTEIEKQRQAYRLKCEEIEQLRGSYALQIEDWRQKSYRQSNQEEYINSQKFEIDRLTNLNKSLLKDQEIYRTSLYQGNEYIQSENNRLKESLTLLRQEYESYRRRIESEQALRSSSYLTTGTRIITTSPSSQTKRQIGNLLISPSMVNQGSGYVQQQGYMVPNYAQRSGSQANFSAEVSGGDRASTGNQQNTAEKEEPAGENQ